MFRGENNLLEAASVGAASSVKHIAYVVVNIIAFLAFLAFFDAVVTYLGARVGYPDISFSVNIKCCFNIAEMIGVWLFILPNAPLIKSHPVNDLSSICPYAKICNKLRLYDFHSQCIYVFVWIGYMAYVVSHFRMCIARRLKDFSFYVDCVFFIFCVPLSDLFIWLLGQLILNAKRVFLLVSCTFDTSVKPAIHKCCNITDVLRYETQWHTWYKEYDFYFQLI